MRITIKELKMLLAANVISKDTYRDESEKAQCCETCDWHGCCETEPVIKRRREALSMIIGGGFCSEWKAISKDANGKESEKVQCCDTCKHRRGCEIMTAAMKVYPRAPIAYFWCAHYEWLERVVRK